MNLVKNVRVADKPGQGWIIEAEIDLGLNDKGEEFVPIYEIPVKPSLSVGDDGKVYATIAYETWYQFPNVNIEKAQEEIAQMFSEMFS